MPVFVALIIMFRLVLYFNDLKMNEMIKVIVTYESEQVDMFNWKFLNSCIFFVQRNTLCSLILINTFILLNLYIK